MRAIFYDTETTGISAKNDFIVEIAAYDPANDKTLCEFVNPGIPIPPDATRIHNITDDMVADAPGFDVVGQQFIDFCEGDSVLIAHNNDAFDVHFLRQEYERAETPMPEWKFLDSLKWARRYRPDLPRHSLQFLREMYSLDANNAHRALDDVYILHKVFELMTDDLDIDTIYELMQRKETITRMPFGKHRGVPLEQVPTNYYKWLAGSGALDKPENSDLKEALDTLSLLPS